MESRLLSASDSFYRWLLQSYPPAFREHFAPDMAVVFRTMCQEAYAESGIGGLAGLGLPVMWDLAWAALYQWELYIYRRTVETKRTT